MLKKITTAAARKKIAELQEIEDKADIENARKVKNETGDPIPWEELKKELQG